MICIRNLRWAAIAMAFAALPLTAAEQQQRPSIPKNTSLNRPKVCRSLGNSGPMKTPLQLDIDLAPLNRTTADPQGEEDLAYSVEITNFSKMAVCVDVWAEVGLPNGKHLDPILLKKNLRLPAGLIAKQQIKQPLPKISPAGAYTIRLQMGTFPHAVLAENQISLEKRRGKIWEFKSGSKTFEPEDRNSKLAPLH